MNIEKFKVLCRAAFVESDVDKALEAWQTLEAFVKESNSADRAQPHTKEQINSALDELRNWQNVAPMKKVSNQIC